ncbi:hypothetical protein A7A76_08505 [Lysobacter enzymogenes]|uniref:DUF2523 family protein n=1 Tax=Lysobacter enzymogenes TaxID=69 RepID=UPI0019D006DE|nr:DUF2523 family protein [Lysobacter enzymogenes]MBN7134759.1 hypothetical protein [Lysobacter enzymogenes]
MPWLGALLASLLGTAAARVLTGVGVGLVTYAALTPLINSGLTIVRNMAAGITGSVLQICLLAGLGDCISMLGSALLTRAAISAGRVAMAKR